MEELPTEIWCKILETLSTRKLLNIRLICSQMRDLSHQFLRHRKFNVTIKNDEDLEKYGELLNNNNSILASAWHKFSMDSITHEKLCVFLKNPNLSLVQKYKFDLRMNIGILNSERELQPIRKNLNSFVITCRHLTDLDIISDGKTKGMELITPLLLKLKNLTYTVEDNGEISVEYKNHPARIRFKNLLNQLLSVAPYLERIIIKGSPLFIGDPIIVPPLVKLKHLILKEAPNSNNYGHAILYHWLLKTPSIQLLETDFSPMCDTVTYLKIFRNIQKIPVVKLRLSFNGDLYELRDVSLNIASLILDLNSSNFSSDEYLHIKAFLSSRSQYLRQLTIKPIRRSPNSPILSQVIDLPILEKLEKLTIILNDEEDEKAFKHFNPEMFPELKVLELTNTFMQNFPFNRIYPTLETFKLEKFKCKNWLRIFPNLTTFETTCNSIRDYENYVDFAPNVRALDLSISFSTNDSYRPEDIWNFLTRNGRVEPESCLHIPGVNDVDLRTTANLPTLAEIPNLRVLRIDGTVVLVKAVAFLASQDKFNKLEKLIIRLDPTYTIPKEIIEIFKNKLDALFLV